jgi:hypothetical protein
MPIQYKDFAKQLSEKGVSGRRTIPAHRYSAEIDRQLNLINRAIAAYERDGDVDKLESAMRYARQLIYRLIQKLDGQTANYENAIRKRNFVIRSLSAYSKGVENMSLRKLMRNLR